MGEVRDGERVLDRNYKQILVTLMRHNKRPSRMLNREAVTICDAPAS